MSALYVKESDGFFKWSNDGPHSRLSNFTAEIVREIRVDDGLSQEILFDLEVTVAGHTFAIDSIPAGDFSSLRWVVGRGGATLSITPGYGHKDHLRAAIQYFSSPETVVVYGHLGWREIDNVPVFLHAGGAIGPFDLGTDECDVEIHASLSRFVLPTPPLGKELRRCIRASLDLQYLAKPEITVPLVSSAFRAPLGKVDHSVWLAGQTGTFKTELAARIQQFFGATMDARHVPVSWSSTVTYAEAVAFQAKDVLLLIDDWVPTGAHAGSQHVDAARFLSAVGNQGGRGRADREGRPLVTRWPRCLPLCTGEDVPAQGSAQARMLIIDIAQGDVDVDVLTAAQQNGAEGLYAGAMAGYVAWLASRDFQDEVKRIQEDLRQKLSGEDFGHRRTPEIVVSLGSGWRMFLNFAVESGAITEEEAEVYWKTGWNALKLAGQQQKANQETTEPHKRFLDLLRGAITSGRAHVAARSGNVDDIPNPGAWGWSKDAFGTWHAKGDCVGWIDGADLYLEPEAAYRVAKCRAGNREDAFNVMKATLVKRLNEQGVLKSIEETRGRLTVRPTICGIRRTVLHLDTSALLPSDDGTDQRSQVVIPDGGDSDEQEGNGE